MRTPFIVGNWKMNGDLVMAVELAKAIVQGFGHRTGMDVALCPPFPYLATVASVVRGSRIQVGGQDCYHEAKGAFTGEVSPMMLKDVGCTLVILGHSERRQLFSESDIVLSKKLNTALAAGLSVIYCVGETLGQRQTGEEEVVVSRQLEGGLGGLTPEQLARVTLAYEPVWAIGTGVTATPEQAEVMHGFIRNWLEREFNPAAAAAIRIQYGGSVNPMNAASLLAQPNVDGFLVGGASLKAGDFSQVIEEGISGSRARGTTRREA